jgi:uncharacterized protein YbcI
VAEDTSHEGQEAEGHGMDLSCEVKYAPRTIQPLRATIIGSLANVFYNPEEGVLYVFPHEGLAATSTVLEPTRSVLEAMVEKVTGVKVVTMHYDISTITGEKVVLLTLARSPDFREAKLK